MTRYGIIRTLIVGAVLLIALTVWAAGQIQASADDDSAHAIDAGEKMLIAMLDQETGLRGYINNRKSEFLDPYRQGRENFDRALANARAHVRDPAATSRIENQLSIARRWQELAQAEVARVAAGDKPVASDVRKSLMDGFRRTNADFIAREQDDRRSARGRAQRLSVAIVVVLGAIFGLFGWRTIERPARRSAMRRARAAEFSDALQVARTEAEAFGVLKRHVEGATPDSRAVVLIRNSSANRLQAATGVEDIPVVAESLEGAAPESCLSVRLAKPHGRESGSRGLLVCDICGELGGPSSCVPTIVGGQVVGSVLVQAPERLDGAQLEELETSVGAAGPVIANLRNLALAEERAATDILTGLANNRSVQDNLNRMVAQAGRTHTQLAAVMFDLDHFKQINDIHGHAKGDEVLAAVGAAVAACVRQSDFVGRYGGEEFVALLPDTNLEGARQLAEKLREAIESIPIPDIDRRVTASLGVAVLPTHAVNGEQLVRAADRALYAAKNAGRNRVEVVADGKSAERRDEPAESRRFDDDLIA